jgi:hypothetical protein
VTCDGVCTKEEKNPKKDILWQNSREPKKEEDDFFFVFVFVFVLPVVGGKAMFYD